MHILLIHQAFVCPDEAGGTRHYEMAQFLEKRGHQVTIIASPISYLSGKSKSERVRWREKEVISPGICVIRAFAYQSLHKSFVHRVINFFSFMVSSFLIGLSIRNVDLVWGTSPPIFQGFTAWLLAFLKRVSFVFEVRDLWPAFAIAVGVLKNKILIKASLWLERFLYRNADVVIVNSPGFIDHVQQKGARKVELIANGVDPSMFDPYGEGRSFRKKEEFGDKFIALYAGAHGLSNDLGVILKAAILLEDQRDITFVLVGDGKDKAALQAQAVRLKLNNVFFLPPVNKNHMAEVLAAADVCIAILKPIDMYKTTYPNKVFDYMAAGRPVALAIDGEIRKVVESASAGLFIPPGKPEEMAQAILSLSKERVKARSMGLAGRKYIEKHFNRQDLSKEFNAILVSLDRKNERK
jgi:glycosyltransferase involved in cell wall biosynthesis